MEIAHTHCIIDCSPADRLPFYQANSTHSFSTSSTGRCLTVFISSFGSPSHCPHQKLPLPSCSALPACCSSPVRHYNHRPSRYAAQQILPNFVDNVVSNGGIVEVISKAVNIAGWLGGFWLGRRELSCSIVLVEIRYKEPLDLLNSYESSLR